MIDLSPIPYANKYDWNECWACWAIGDPDKNQDTWHVTIKNDAYAVIDIVMPVSQLEAGDYSPFQGKVPPINPLVPIWIAYSDRLTCSTKTPFPLPEWVSKVLRPQLSPWDGIERDHVQESINNSELPAALTKFVVKLLDPLSAV